jgi:hypothetical protein
VSTTTKIIWAWGTNTHIAFNATTDILDFGWFAAGQFTISEVNGSVVIAIPSNHQTYTLDNTTLSELHLSNIAGKDPTAISEWTTALGSATTTPPPVTPPIVTPPVTPPVVTPPPVTPPTSGASSWSSSAVYTAGMTATENGVTYKANWWVQRSHPVVSDQGLHGRPGGYRKRRDLSGQLVDAGQRPRAQQRRQRHRRALDRREWVGTDAHRSARAIRLGGDRNVLQCDGSQLERCERSRPFGGDRLRDFREQSSDRNDHRH